MKRLNARQWIRLADMLERAHREMLRSPTTKPLIGFGVCAVTARAMSTLRWLETDKVARNASQEMDGKLKALHI